MVATLVLGSLDWNLMHVGIIIFNIRFVFELNYFNLSHLNSSHRFLL